MKPTLSNLAKTDLLERCPNCDVDRIDNIVELETDNWNYENPDDSHDYIRPILQAEAEQLLSGRQCVECDDWERINSELDNHEE